jgi:hypothetical protein
MELEALTLPVGMGGSGLTGMELEALMLPVGMGGSGFTGMELAAFTTVGTVCGNEA